MQLLDGRLVAKDRQIKLSEKVRQFKSKHGRAPGLAVILVGEDPASQVYVRNKGKACADAGMQNFQVNLPASTSQADLEREVERLNNDASVDGLLVQLPLPQGLDAERVARRLSPMKDADGLTAENVGLLWSGRPRVAACTPSGVMRILEFYGIDVKGKDTVVIGRSQIVGRPMAALLLDASATVTVCHSKTKDLFKYTKAAEVVVVAAGQPRFLGAEAFAKNSVVVDVGMHRITDASGKTQLCGDVRFEELEGHVKAATPVPGGVGPMTIQMLLENTLTLAELHV